MRDPSASAPQSAPSAQGPRDQQATPEKSHPAASAELGESHPENSFESLLGFGDDAGAEQDSSTARSGRDQRVGAQSSLTSTAAGDSGVNAPSDRERRRQALNSDSAPQRRRGRWIKPVIVVVVIVSILGGGAVFAYSMFKPQIDAIAARFQPSDYEGDGTGEVMIQIVEGDNGEDIAATLADNDVVLTSRAFYSLLLGQPTEIVFHPGTYRLKQQMSAQAALTALQDEANRLENGFVIPEGTGIDDVFSIISAGLDIPVKDLEKAAEDPSSFGLPAEATTLEGFLFPATYTFEPGVSATEVLTRLVDRSLSALDDAGVEPDKRWTTVILASLIQREAGLAPDYPKVARVFLNRLDSELWPSGLLQSDATVAYGTGNTHTVETTPAERADASNPYNTYANPGLPVGPISNPGDLAINAALNPADGDWLYFVTWNLDSGETAFSTTLEEHEAAVARWQEWMAANR
ncbi:MAG: endolytic transglycosylase MltG [Mycetocola sp.]